MSYKQGEVWCQLVPILLKQGNKCFYGLDNSLILRFWREKKQRNHGRKRKRKSMIILITILIKATMTKSETSLKASFQCRNQHSPPDHRFVFKFFQLLLNLFQCCNQHSPPDQYFSCIKLPSNSSSENSVQSSSPKGKYIVVLLRCYPLRLCITKC